MPKIDTGGYLVRFYDRYGTPQKQLDEMAGCYTEALMRGDIGLTKRAEEVSSYTVDRRLFNSIDKRGWS